MNERQQAERIIQENKAREAETALEKTETRPMSGLRNLPSENTVGCLTVVAFYYRVYVVQSSQTEKQAAVSSLTDPFRRRLGTLIKRYERWTSIRGKEDLMKAGMTEIDADQAMTEFMKQVDDKQNINNYDVKYV